MCQLSLQLGMHVFFLILGSFSGSLFADMLVYCQIFLEKYLRYEETLRVQRFFRLDTLYGDMFCSRLGTSAQFALFSTAISPVICLCHMSR